jgi:hypothetical protein
MAASLPNEPDDLLITDELRHRRRKLGHPASARQMTEQASVRMTGRAAHSQALETE